MGPDTLILGATGYVGSCLTNALLERGTALRLAGRRTTELAARFPTSDVVFADAMDPSTLAAPLDGIRTSYYLIHSMGDARQGFEERDRQAASSFAHAAAEAGVPHRNLHPRALRGQSPAAGPHPDVSAGARNRLD